MRYWPRVTTTVSRTCTERSLHLNNEQHYRELTDEQHYRELTDEQHYRELGFIALSMIGIGGVLYYIKS